MDKEILISTEGQEKRLAVLENRRLEEFYIERAGDVQLVGSIYKGRVNSVLPGIGAAFIDIGLQKNGFLYVSDIVEMEEFDLVGDESNGGSAAAGQQSGGHHGSHHRRHARIDELLKNGQEVLVQVVKEPLGTKGARLTSHVSLPGRYLVLMPTENHLGISKRIGDEEERRRLKTILQELRPGNEDVGLIVRTAGLGKGKREFARDIRYLKHLWHRVKRQVAHAKPPAMVYQEYDMAPRIIRDSFTEDIKRIVVDTKDEHRRILHFLRMLVPNLHSKLELYRGEEPLFVREGIEDQISVLYERTVKLPSGGSIVIEQTESLVAIDVNSSHYTGRKNLEETVLVVNKEAAVEIARQLRLRDVGGIIIIDFIDMEVPGHRREVLATLEQALKRDRAKTNIVSFSELCLVEMTRQRMRRSVQSFSHQSCPYCEGRGMVKSVATVSVEALRQVRRALRESKRTGLEVFVHPQVASRLLKEDRNYLSQLERQFHAKVFVMSDPSVHLESVRIQPA